MPLDDKMAPRDRRTAYSAGGVIYRENGAGFDVALIATNAGRRWGLPKGHVRHGEAAEAAAAREIAEETGVSINTLLSRKRYAILALRKKLQQLYNDI
jgi:8-oxo-dGTP pyrophosphatase MutT (NUDIX family)